MIGGLGDEVTHLPVRMLRRVRLRARHPVGGALPMSEADDIAEQGDRDVTSPNWAAIAQEAAAQGFGVPDTSAGGSDELPPRVPLEPGKRRRGRPRKDAAANPANPANAIPPKPETPLPPYREGMFVQPLEEMYGYIGMGLMLADPVCGQAIIKAAHECAVSLDAMARRNKGVRRVLVTLTQTSDIGKVMVAHLPIITAIALHHVPAVRNMLGGMGENIMAGMQAQAEGREPDAA